MMDNGTTQDYVARACYMHKTWAWLLRN